MNKYAIAVYDEYEIENSIKFINADSEMEALYILYELLTGSAPDVPMPNYPSGFIDAMSYDLDVQMSKLYLIGGDA